MADDRVEIYCPQCKWRPGPLDRWSCTPRCGTVWNTFWTRAICPGCGVRWPKTQCLACQVFSPHEDWYHEPEPSKRERQREEERAGEREGEHEREHESKSAPVGADGGLD